ncbi:uncharacterized protein LOC128233873 [Mya arenaria]|uniref:uncharacterized protein LOC128233873 n=1 Tax=Mya arenaria TaxID=6604 RepID=UPI0022DFEB54|nr:uncharacterized protein LOC128233873 [Mya arenaria]XP_052803699.1 uncharacterized protein LOC128233873 [Mya arenaria]
MANDGFSCSLHYNLLLYKRALQRRQFTDAVVLCVRNLVIKMVEGSTQESTFTTLYGWIDLSGSCSLKWFRDIEVKQYKVPLRVKGCLLASDSQSSLLMISEFLTQSPQS